MQAASHLLMIRPARFAFNEQTAVNNAFQVKEERDDIPERALQEFDALVQQLRAHAIEVTVLEDNPEPHTPDAVFPNNWISFQEEQTICLYPMYALNRRQERKPAILESISRHFPVKNQVDLTHYERENKFLEGTGSLVLDRENRVAYAGLSPRTDRTVLEDFCSRFRYSPCIFHAVDRKGNPIYHTNVMMCVADRFVVICLDAIRDAAERGSVSRTIRSTGKEIIPISLDQMENFAGNMLQVENTRREKFLVMSTAAFNALTEEQVKKLESWNRIIHSPLPTIETNGGGSARCMIAEGFGE